MFFFCLHYYYFVVISTAVVNAAPSTITTATTIMATTVTNNNNINFINTITNNFIIFTIFDVISSTVHCSQEMHLPTTVSRTGAMGLRHHLSANHAPDNLHRDLEVAPPTSASSSVKNSPSTSNTQADR